MGTTKKDKNMAKNYKELVKKDREKKLVFRVRKFIMCYGNVAVPIYIGFSSMIIAYLYIIILYNTNRSSFLSYLNNYQGGVLIADIFWSGMLVVIIWGTIGILSIFIYKYYLKMKAYGFNQPKGIFEKAAEVNKEDLENWKKKVK